ncbi:MAG: type II secretion system protein [candidate division NC10 bacterium]|nr:type II secretion system protein [candidate division NC10 bacterium]
MPSKSCQSGFTLLEVMVAVAVMGALLVTLIYTLNYHLTIAERQESLTLAYLLARDKMEEMEQGPAETKGEFAEPYSHYHYLTEIKTSLYPDMSEIHVLVSDGKEEAKIIGLTRKRE